jgi:hypothetical protein
MKDASNLSAATASVAVLTAPRASGQRPSPTAEPQSNSFMKRSPVLEITKSVINLPAPVLPHHLILEQQKAANDKYDKIAEQFANEEVVELIERSTTYSKIIRAEDPEEFMDITLIQWDTCTANILSFLREEFRENKVVPTQSLLIRVCKLAARKIYKRHKLVMKLESKTT